MKDIVQQNTHASFLHIVEDIPNISSERLFDIGPLTIANSTTTVLLITLLFVLLALVVRKFKIIPTSFQNSVEIFYEYIVSLVSQIVGDKEQGKMLTPYIGSIMLYLLVSNLLPMVPGLSSITIGSEAGPVELFRGTTTDFNTTFGLALAVVVFMQIVGMRSQGVVGYLSHFVQVKQVYQGFRKGIGSGAVSIVGFFVGLIEIVSEFAKVLSLSLRLFGNMFAHEVLTVILLGAFSVGVPAIWMGMGLLVGVVQSLVFVSLVTVYFSLVAKKTH